ncbi:Crp/Fnr family transcriptional regulator [Flagellimonas alvinocaridis]|uniref:Crp/Fnr family transcriptional regulator n=1 Tax=Flagellimonas alvinocaridis TaxID=2530200 RepID=A0A4S8RH15_9FLAO|nr:Crp/Fnr family transcriptional regulator [Allomuricauda alvinocaridis]THV57633.1 Crp/Fnr family transcriptional regulator [Allomuricauda alvinocaridis]
MHESLLLNISKHVKLSPEEIRLFNTFWTTKILEKGDYLLQNGEVCKTDNYVISGSLKAFYINPEKGTEEILYFAIDDWWATDILSFQKQEPSMYTIQALERTELLQIQHLAFQKMLAEIPRLERYFRIILEGYTASLQRRIVINNTYDAAHRYADFLENYPQLTKRVPQYLIASYLGVTPEFISRIRKNKPKLN